MNQFVTLHEAREKAAAGSLELFWKPVSGEKTLKELDEVMTKFRVEKIVLTGPFFKYGYRRPLQPSHTKGTKVQKMQDEGLERALADFGVAALIARIALHEARRDGLKLRGARVSRHLHPGFRA